MPKNYIVQANVIDITSDIPQKGDIFLVDTNVWRWLTYRPPNVSRPSESHQGSYSDYIEDAMKAGATLCCSGLSLAELAHIIEKQEQKLSTYKSINNKEYRHNYPKERTKIVSRVQKAWNQVQNTYAILINLNLDQTTVDAALNRFSNQCLDGYDLFILESMQQESITKIITDDGDYVTVPGIQVFTANPEALTSARSQGKLIIR
jgi:predicted nucleic acid-binding protein